MSDEATIHASLSIRKTDSNATLVLVDYASRPTAFTADVTGAKGPVPGAIEVLTTGTNVDLSQLTTPGLCRIMNQDDTNWVEFGIWEPDTGRFYPLGELLPGESYVLRLSRQLGEEYGGGAGTGTGTLVAGNVSLRFRANNAACNVLIEAFEA